MPQRSLSVLLLALAVPVAAEPPAVLVCRGHEPEWSLRIDGPRATLATLDARGLTQAALEGRLQEAGGPLPVFVFRGRASASEADLVAVITREACLDTMADAAEGGGPSDFAARVSLPDGALRLGCCVTPVAPAPPAEASRRPQPSAPPGPAVVPPATAAAPPPAAVARPAATGGAITALTLPDGRVCRRAGTAGTFRGQRVHFECGRSGGDTVALVGPLAVNPQGVLAAQKALIEWREGLAGSRQIETTAAQATEIALADGLTCRFAGTGATLAFEGRRASYTCGMKDGDTVALLGDLEPVEGGCRIVRARIGHGDGGFSLRASEPILVTFPR